MSEKNIILNDWSNRHRVMTPLPKESVNPIIRFFNRQFELISQVFQQVGNPLTNQWIKTMKQLTLFIHKVTINTWRQQTY